MSKSEDRKAPCWGLLCPVDVTALVAAIATRPPVWAPVIGNEPNNAAAPQEAQPIVQAVCDHLGRGVTARGGEGWLSRLVPGVEYGYHRDGQPREWITRVHVPLLTNDSSWFAWEEDGGWRVFMHVGQAYAFNTMKAHAYANKGTTDRVHLIFDALEG